jgi:hypothetical protein
MEEEMLQRGGIQALLLPPPSLGVVIEIKYQGWVPNELVAMRTTRMMTSPSSSSWKCHSRIKSRIGQIAKLRRGCVIMKCVRASNYSRKWWWQWCLRWTTKLQDQSGIRWMIVATTKSSRITTGTKILKKLYNYLSKYSFTCSSILNTLKACMTYIHGLRWHSMPA